MGCNISPSLDSVNSATQLGLRKQETFHDIRYVPILGDIPLPVLLFQSKTEIQVTNELLIFITPNIITHPVLIPSELKQLQNTEIEAWESPDNWSCVSGILQMSVPFCIPADFSRIDAYYG